MGQILNFEENYLARPRPRAQVGTLKSRFLAKVEKTESCWLWLGAPDVYGYGILKFACRPFKAHRVAYELFVGDIPEAFTVDHLCRNKICVRPDHLEAVTASENSRRKAGLKTHCPQEHEYTTDNSKMYKGAKSCRTCIRERSRRQNLRKRLEESK